MDIEKLKEIKNKICRNERTKITVKSLGKILPKKKEFPVLQNERGNFCFVNAATQMLFSLPPFMKLINDIDFNVLTKYKVEQTDEELENDKKIFNAIKNYFKNIMKENDKKNEKKEIEKIFLKSQYGKQNDSMEFIPLILSKLEFYKNNENIKNFFELIDINEETTIKAVNTQEIYSKTSIKNHLYHLQKIEGEGNNITNPEINMEQYFNDLYVKPELEVIQEYKYTKNEITKTTNAHKFTKPFITEKNKYFIIYNDYKNKKIYNEDRTITIKDESDNDVIYKLIGCMIHKGIIELYEGGKMGGEAKSGHYVYFYLNGSDIQRLDDGENIKLTEEDLKQKQYLDEIQSASSLLYERVPIIDNLPSGGGYKITKKNKITKIKNNKIKNNKIKNNNSKKSKYSNKHKRSNKKISRHNKKYN
jgi:hypothetical protein